MGMYHVINSFDENLQIAVNIFDPHFIEIEILPDGLSIFLQKH